MKTSSPFKTLKSSPLFANGGVQIPTQPHKGEGTDSKVGRKKQSEIEYKDVDEEFETVASFAPVTGEIIDAKNTVIDLKKGDYAGAVISAAGLGLPILSGKFLKGLFGSGKKMTKQQKMDFEKGFAESNGNPITGGVSGNTLDPRIKTGVNPKTGYKYDQEFMDLTTPVPSFNRQQLMEVEIPKMKALGKSLDDSNFDVSSLTKDNITFKGRSGGRTIVEVDLGNGQKQLFYKSTGSAGKAGSGVGGTTEGLWQPYAGHQKNAGGGVGPGWFGKDSGYEDWYKSKSYRDISGNLDKLSREKGINLDMQMNLSLDLSDKAKKKAYKDLTNADLNEAFQNYSKRVGADQTDNAQIIIDQ